jgi:N-acyl homoserine lactone hydrolase
MSRIYVFAAMMAALAQSRWTPGVNAGQPLELSNNCYLFKHEHGTGEPRRNA